MSEQALAAQARQHWKQWLPEKTALLTAKGEFEQAVQAAAKLAQAEVDSLMRQGFKEHEALEVARSRFILLPPEPGADVPEDQRDELAELEREYQDMMRETP